MTVVAEWKAVVNVGRGSQSAAGGYSHRVPISLRSGVLKE